MAWYVLTDITDIYTVRKIQINHRRYVMYISDFLAVGVISMGVHVWFHIIYVYTFYRIAKIILWYGYVGPNNNTHTWGHNRTYLSVHCIEHSLLGWEKAVNKLLIFVVTYSLYQAKSTQSQWKLQTTYIIHSHSVFRRQVIVTTKDFLRNIKSLHCTFKPESELYIMTTAPLRMVKR